MASCFVWFVFFQYSSFQRQSSYLAEDNIKNKNVQNTPKTYKQYQDKGENEGQKTKKKKSHQIHGFIVGITVFVIFTILRS